MNNPNNPNNFQPVSIEKSTYSHFKTGALYDVIGVALHTETGEQLVIYRPLYESDHELFARPYDMFIGSVEVDGEELPRFRAE